MLKALRVSSYRKRAASGKINDIFVYEVSGTVSELEAYKQAMLSQPNTRRTEENWAETGCAKNGKPLHWLVADVANGSIPKPSLNLTITINGRIVVDNTIEKANSMEQLAHMAMQAEAQGIADIKLGLRAVVANNFSSPSTTATPVAAEPKADENAEDFHEAVKSIEEKVDAGTEALAD